MTAWIVVAIILIVLTAVIIYFVKNSSSVISLLKPTDTSAKEVMEMNDKAEKIEIEKTKDSAKEVINAPIDIKIGLARKLINSGRKLRD